MIQVVASRQFVVFFVFVSILNNIYFKQGRGVMMMFDNNDEKKITTDCTRSCTKTLYCTVQVLFVVCVLVCCCGLFVYLYWDEPKGCYSRTQLIKNSKRTIRQFRTDDLCATVQVPGSKNILTTSTALWYTHPVAPTD
jgi:hypothetical protein